MKPYQQVPILECGEPLVPIPLDMFAIASPHPYQFLGASYADRSPYYLRQGVLSALITAQSYLQQQRPGWRIQIFDAYRPLEVQQFMVNYSFAEVVKAQGLQLDNLSPLQQEEIWQQVYQFWAIPNYNPATPPPHSTGAAIDITLVNHHGEVVDMGSPIDEISERSHPNYFADSTDTNQQLYHAHRLLLWDIMRTAGFQRHWNEWWHFSLGDQMWAWLCQQENRDAVTSARYGRIL